VLTLTEENKKSSLISVIVPVYNVEEFLPRCIESIICQTHENLEIILVDDGSPDKSGDICDDYAKRDNRIHVIHQKNAGVCTARNAGLDVAQGEWVSFIDSDDWIEPDMYERLLEAAAQNNKMVARCNFIQYRSEYMQREFIRKTISSKLTQEEAIANCLKPRSQNFIGVCGGVFHHSLFGSVNNPCIRFDSSIYLGEDTLIAVQALLKTDGIAYVPMPMYYYYYRDASAVRTINEKSMTVLIACKQIVESVKTVSSKYELWAQLFLIQCATILVVKSCRVKQYKLVGSLRQEILRKTRIWLPAQDFGIIKKIQVLGCLLLPNYIIGAIARRKGIDF